MLSKEGQAATASQGKAKAKAAVRQPKAKVKPSAKKDLRDLRIASVDEESSADNDEQACKEVRIKSFQSLLEHICYQSV